MILGIYHTEIEIITYVLVGFRMSDIYESTLQVSVGRY